MKGDKAKLKVVSQAVGRPADKVIDIRGLSLIFQTADTPVFALSDIDLSIAGSSAAAAGNYGTIIERRESFTGLVVVFSRPMPS